MDLLDILSPAKGKFPFTGAYYGEVNVSPEEGRCMIRYKFENPRSTTYRMLFSNIQDFDSTTTAIRTNTNVGVKIGGYVILQDGESYVIDDIAKDYNTAPQEVFRLGNSSPAIEYVLRLIKTDNPWDMR